MLAKPQHGARPDASSHAAPTKKTSPAASHPSQQSPIQSHTATSPLTSFIISNAARASAPGPGGEAGVKEAESCRLGLGLYLTTGLAGGWHNSKYDVHPSCSAGQECQGSCVQLSLSSIDAQQHARSTHWRPFSLCMIIICSVRSRSSKLRMQTR